ncbi:MAG: cysteine synthase A [Sulfurimonadaceae bacterium]|jgi:cysteine synthase A|nr:cysteine synthase A [Sulfurimonadaceae bacterium]
MVANSIVELIGKTPLIRLNRLSELSGANIYAKCEFLNPTGSVKDRAAYSMLIDAIDSGKIDKNTTIIEPTSGNTGIALAALCASMGYKLTLTMPESMSIERRKLLGFFGAELVLTPSSKGMNGAIDKAKELHQNIQNSIILGQFTNPANPMAHEKTTAIEIIEDLGKIDAFIAAVGTGGTLSGSAKKLKEYDKDIKIFAVEPQKSAVLSGENAAAHGIQGIGAGFIPDILDTSLYGEVITIKDEDAIEMAKQLAKDEGLLVGISSGANVVAAKMVASRDSFRGKTIVTVLCDTGERYLSTALFE